MATSDALIVGEDWISEHYFTTDATKESFQAKVLARRKQWQDEKDDGTVRTRFTAIRRALLDQLAALDEAADPTAAAEIVHDQLLDVLGYTRPGLTRTEPDEDGPVTRIGRAGLSGAGPLAIVRAKPVETVDELLAKNATTLSQPYHYGDEELTSVARTLSTLFVDEDAPAFALVLAGRYALVAERERWAEGRYLAVDLQLVAERADDTRGGETDRALACLDAQSLAPDAEGTIWWTEVLEDSVRHTVGVSEDLRDGVRLSIEIIGNEVVDRRRAQGLDPLPADQAQPLAQQSLRFLYRILFLLYAEASPEMGVLPAGAPEYERGYSLDRLRDLTLVELTTAHARAGTHLYESLRVLFDLVDTGHDGGTSDDDAAAPEGLTFRNLQADLFGAEATAHIDTVGLGDGAMQQVLRHLLLSKERKGHDRGFISYAELGINQLGAVYEGLMSYTGFFAEEDLYEVAKNGDASKGSWVVPVDRAGHIAEKDFVKAEDPVTGESKAVLHERGSFVFRLSGRARQQSASYYTPEVLTRFTVSQALAELLDQDGRTTPAREILDLTVCEPALGSGAFAIEAVRQLAEEYLKRRQEETGERIDPDEYPRALQKVKAYIALHQVYGVDLNATAVELAEISLWLDTMVAGLDAPWFGLHLRRGNSLIGARRAVYRRSQVSDKTWLKAVPRDVPLNRLAEDAEHDRLATGLDGGIHHFLLPAEGWGATTDAKEAKELAPEARDRLRAWQRSIRSKPSKKQIDALVDLSYRVERLWQIALRRLQLAEQEIRRSIDVWGADDLPVGGRVQRHQIEEALNDAGSAYRRLRRVMDAWCALWFWPLTDRLTTVEVDGEVKRIEPPTLDQWIEAVQGLLGRHTGSTKATRGHDQTLSAGVSWDELGDYEAFDQLFASVSPVESVLREHPWLRVCEAVAEEQGFFHWELDFAAPMARGGFDLQVGNPPWVRPTANTDVLLAEGDPWWQLKGKVSQEELASARERTLDDHRGIRDLLVTGTAEVAATSEFLGARQQYPHLSGLQPDLYRCFMEQVWRYATRAGISALIHPETHLTDNRGGPLRAATYRHLRRFWHFKNAKALFDASALAVDNFFGVHIYGATRDDVSFLTASHLYHPDVVERSLSHDGTGSEPGVKDEDGNWDIRPHAHRVSTISMASLEAFHEVMENPDTPVRHARMLFFVNRSSARALQALVKWPRIAALKPYYSSGWHEKSDHVKGHIRTEWGVPDSWDDVILQGPHLHVARPFYKNPNPTMRNKQDWTLVDLEHLDGDAIPTTSFKPERDRARYGANYTVWHSDGASVPARDTYRVAWRRRMQVDRERSLMPAIIPPGAAHVDAVHSLGCPSGGLSGLVSVAGFMSSLVSDYFVRAVGKGDLRSGLVGALPIRLDHPLMREVQLRTLALNCMTKAYGQLWKSCYEDVFKSDRWITGLRAGDPLIRNVDSDWKPEFALKVAADRRNAIAELDSAVALMLDIEIDELCSIYRTQFSILRKYDRTRDFYDANGWLVPNEMLRVWRTKGDRISVEERTATNQAGYTYTYELPFRTLDREHDMRVAYAEFERRLKERS